MDMMTTTQTWILVGVIGVLVLALIAWLSLRKKQSYRPRERFGPELGQGIENLGSAKDESELKVPQGRA